MSLFEEFGPAGSPIAEAPSSAQLFADAYAENTPAKQKSAPNDSESWTYLVNLTATMLPGAGAKSKYDKLQSLKDLTSNSDSEVIVQEFDEKTRTLNRYKISHGKIEEAKPVQSAGTASDLQDLLSSAPRTGHLALINEAHGNGDKGFTGDDSDISVDDFKKAVKKGLADNGRDNLDLLSLDSCLMANVQALNSISGLAKNIVASELEQFSSVSMSSNPPVATYDMQPIDQYLSALIQHTPQNGREAAEVILSVASKSCDALAPENQACGTPTLAIIKPEAASQANTALDNLGEQLQVAVKDAKIKQTVDSLIAQTHDVSQADDHLRDVDSFAKGIIDLISQGSIKDDNGHLKHAAQEVLKADSNLIGAFYVNPNTTIVKVFGLQDKLHGVNTFLPGPQFDIRAEAENIVGPIAAQKLPLNELLDKEIKASLPDAYSGAWAGFIRTMRAAG
ncbi:MAG: hypothetical protein K2X81_00700 [Candidatus Obscuribacterales bacterium]|nr:hypothetical protein [Candidatus Obscuribacterales bacterium]